MISFCRRGRIGGRLTELGVRRARDAGATVLERPNPSESDLSHALAGGLLPVATRADADRVLAWIAEPDAALALHERGVHGWRITVAAHGAREQILDAVVRSGAVFLRTVPDRLDEALAVARLPGVETAVSLEVADLDQAVAAVRAGVADLVLDDWGDEVVGELRVALAPARVVERTAFPVGLEVDDARDALGRPALKAYLDQVDAHGAVRPRYAWAPGKDALPPVPTRRLSAAWADRAWREGEPADGLNRAGPRIADVLQRALDGTPPTREEIETLFWARDEDVEVIARVADELRRRAVGDTVTYVINRNINYTNQCYFRCGFCGFSKGPKSLNHRGEPYMLEIHEVVHRSVEAWEQGATEVCLQGGIHPEYTGDFYVGVLEAIKARLPQMHVHGFTPLEVWQGAHTLGVSVRSFLTRLRDAGLGTLPGTAAEVLDDAVRVHLCPDKVRTAEWAEVMITAHELGLRATSTLMCGHIDSPRSWANHVEVIREIQRRTGGFTEFVPLPFVHMGSPIYLQGRSRPGPTWDEVVLVHAVPRIAFDGLIPNIQASWVKLGLAGGARLLEAGCNDLGGTLMNENISRASGAAHGQLATPQELEAAARAMGRTPARRSTVYEILEIPA
jgi:7,8-didemethyl-8-hydroxy-5-deazariboflavin synthase CofH subunit